MKLKICFLILNNLTFIQVIASFTVHAAGEYIEKENITCQNGYCGSNSYKYILAVFNGLFHTSKDLSMLDNVNNNALATPLPKDEPAQIPPALESKHYYADDGGICCSTHVEHQMNTTMNNILGESMSIIHLSDASEPSYQYIPHASCVRTGSCPGECIIESKILTLLALDAEQGLTFGSFEVPGYCSCKNTGRSGK